MEKSEFVITEAMEDIFSTAQTAMKNTISKSDYLSNTPLEIAYRWALPVQSFASKRIRLNGEIFTIGLQMLSGKIFDGDEATQINSLIEEKIKPNTFYFVEEGKGKKSRPLFDLFFLGNSQNQNEQTLVLIDITGGTIAVADAKLERISNWIGKQKLDKFVLKGFVLAPGAKMENKTDDSGNTTIIGQEEALVLLGGLRQISNWLIEENEANEEKIVFLKE